MSDEYSVSVRDNPLAWVSRYLEYRKGRESLETVEGQVKKYLMGFLAADCPADSKGSSTFQLPLPVGDVEAIKRERRVSQALDEDAAMRAIEQFGLTDCLETITVINEDALLAANYSGRLPDDVVAGLYTQKESFAFVLVKSKNR